MHIGIITYQTGHLKTLQLMFKLMAASYRITLFAFPFKLRPQNQPIFSDRPFQLIDCDIPAFCRMHGIGYVKVNGWTDDNASALGNSADPYTPDVFLTCIAKIIPASFINGRLILNCHPGLLPHNRGLDAFKWCVVNDWPFGITLHAIDEAIDRGIILHRRRVPVLSADILSDVSSRAYSMELDLMASFERYLPNLANQWQVGDTHPLSKKMVPQNIEADIENMFLEKRNRFVELSADFTVQPHSADILYANQLGGN